MCQEPAESLTPIAENVLPVDILSRDVARAVSAATVAATSTVDMLMKTVDDIMGKNRHDLNYDITSSITGSHNRVF